MRLLWPITLLVTTLSCGGNSEGPSTADKTDIKAGAATPTAAGGVQVSGTLAPTIAPPSSLVVLEPQSDTPVPVKTEPAIIDQVSLEFLPAFLLAQTGQTVEFRNGEDVLHNIRVTEVADQKPVFNIATPPFGKYEYKFERTGFYTVGCDIHQTMRADILVTATPYTTTTAGDGSFSFGDVKPGSYTLVAYGGAAPYERPVEVKSARIDLGMIK
jgi:plastocyanin